MQKYLIPLFSIIKKSFLFISLAIMVALCAFHCWIYWPGFIQDDAQTTFLLLKSGWHPVIMADMVELMYAIFGYHIWTLFILTMFPFYLGVWVIVYAVYKKTNSWWSLLFFFPYFSGNIFFLLIKMGTSSFAVSYLYLLWALTLYVVLNPIRKKLLFYGFYGLIFIIALLGRHNAILEVWPTMLVFIGIFLSKKQYAFWGYMWRFFGLAFLSGIITSVMFFSLNKALVRTDLGHAYPETLVTMHQIVGTCAPELDESCFDSSWWTDEWQNDPNRMLSLKRKYEHNLLDSEPFVVKSYEDLTGRQVTFRYHTDLKGRFSKLWYAVNKYPQNYIKHLKRFYKVAWHLPGDKIPREFLSHAYTRKGMIYHSSIWNPLSDREKAEQKRIVAQFPEKELFINFTPSKKEADTFARNHYPFFGIFFFVCANFVFFGLSLILWLINRNNYLNLYFMSVSCAGFLGNIFIPMFCPRVFTRYMDPIIICAVLELIAFLLVLNQYKEKPVKYLYNLLKKKRALLKQSSNEK